MPSLTASNTLYVVSFDKAKTQDDSAAIGIVLFTTFAARSMQKVIRRYADGLLKIEPGDFSRIEIPVVTEPRGAQQEYRRLFKLYLSGDLSELRKKADRWVAARAVRRSVVTSAIEAGAGGSYPVAACAASLYSHSATGVHLSCLASCNMPSRPERCIVMTLVGVANCHLDRVSHYVRRKSKGGAVDAENVRASTSPSMSCDSSGSER